jgi:hypothetical protein
MNSTGRAALKKAILDALGEPGAEVEIGYLLNRLRAKGVREADVEIKGELWGMIADGVVGLTPKRKLRLPARSETEE